LPPIDSDGKAKHIEPESDYFGAACGCYVCFVWPVKGTGGMSTDTRLWLFPLVSFLARSAVFPFGTGADLVTGAAGVLWVPSGRPIAGSGSWLAAMKTGVPIGRQKRGEQ
jgi:hypothetical protein